MMDKYLGESIPKLGFGFMRLPMQGEEVDMEQTTRMVDAFMKEGFTYFDTARAYYNGKAEAMLKEVLVDRYPRESFQVTSKMPFWSIKSEEEMQATFHESLEQLGVEYIDYYLLHALDKEKIKLAEKFNAWEYMKQMKAEGKIKHFGFSFHDTVDVLEELLEAHGEETEFVQLQINYADWENENIQSRKCYEVARKYNKPVIIMEPIKGGLLANLPENGKKICKELQPDLSIASWAMRYCASLDHIVTVLSGMSNYEQVIDNMSYMKEVCPLNDAEYEALNKVTEELEKIPTIPCTGCGYCVEDCPAKIKIPGLFTVANQNKIFGEEGKEPVNKGSYNWNVDGAGKAGDCVACGSCEAHCPQHIEIINEMNEISKLYD